MFAKLRIYVARHHLALLALFVALGGTSYAAAKLPRNSVGTKQLKRNAVISSKVKDRSLLARDFRRGQLPRGAPGPQGPRGLQGIQGAKGDKGDKGDPTYKRTVLVSPVGTDPQNGVALRNAIAAITDASVTKPYLVEIEPGTYDLGATALKLKPYVDVEGSGATTAIKASVDSQSSGAIVGSSNTYLRYVDVWNINSGASASVAVYASGTNSGFRLDHVYAMAIGGGTAIGLRVVNGAVVVHDGGMTATSPGSAYGLYSDHSTPYVFDAGVGASGGPNFGYGLYQNGGTVTVFSSRLEANAYSVLVTGNGAAHIAGTGLNGLSSASPGSTLSCAQSFNAATFTDVAC